MRSDILHWFEQNIKRWVKPARLVLISGLLSDITLSRGELIAENAFLRQQIMVLDRQIKRPRLTNQDRLLFVLLARFTKFWKQSILIVQPETLLRWHRELFRWHWRKKIPGQAKDPARNDCLDPKDSRRKSLVGSEANTGGTVEVGD